jgi:hypothetical protein
MRLGKGVERTIDMKDEAEAVPVEAPEKAPEPQEKAPEEAQDTEADVALPLEEAAEPEPVG